MKSLQVSVFLCVFLGIAAAWDEDIGSPDTDTDPAFAYHSYVPNPYCSPSTATVYPKNITELQDLVHQAISTGGKLKPLGSRHSRNDVICTDGTPVSMDNFNFTVLNPDNTVTTGGGTKLRSVLLHLLENNRSLINTPKYTGISIGGAIGTGAHGSSLLHAPTLSDQVLSMTVVNGLGELKTISTQLELKAWKIHLGLLGFVVSVTLETVPLFKINMTRSREPDSHLLDSSIINRARTSDLLELQWFPNQQIITVSESTYVPASTPGSCYETFFTEATPQSAGGTKFIFDKIQEHRMWNAHYALEEVYSHSYQSQVVGIPPAISDDGITFQNPGVGLSWQMIAGQCFGCYWDMGEYSYYIDDDEVAINLQELSAAVETIKAIVRSEHIPIVSVGIAFRFIKQSQAVMSFTNGWNETVVIELISPSRNDPYNNPKYGLAVYQAILQALIIKHNGRPHWGKNGLQYLSRDVLNTTVPGRDDFLVAMRENDPNGIFMNKFAARLTGLSSHMDIHPNMSHCALENYCVCKAASDCAEGQVCNTFSDGDDLEYSVCQDTATFPDPPLPSYNPFNVTSVIQAIISSICDLESSYPVCSNVTLFDTHINPHTW